MTKRRAVILLMNNRSLDVPLVIRSLYFKLFLVFSYAEKLKSYLLSWLPMRCYEIYALAFDVWRGNSGWNFKCQVRSGWLGLSQGAGLDSSQCLQSSREGASGLGNVLKDL